MTLNKKSLDLSYKILANLQVSDYNKHISDLKTILLAAFIEVYSKARHDESQGEEWDSSFEMNYYDTDV
jgi:hypothetical protein